MIDILNDEMVSFFRYENNQIIYIDKNGKDHKVKDKMTFGEWIKIHKEVSNIKIEGLEDKLFHSKILKDLFIDQNKKDTFIENITFKNLINEIFFSFDLPKKNLLR